MVERFVIISGCSGGGKSTLLAELSRRSYSTVEEPGRRIVAEELANGGAALPWIDPAAFARRALEVSLRDLEFANGRTGWVFFDRGLIDAASGLKHITGVMPTLGAIQFYRTVFMAPPWPEIYENDPARKHDMSTAVEEYDRLLLDYPALGYDVVVLPKVSVVERADFILQQLV